MKFRLIVTILLLTAVPATLYARWIKDLEVYQIEATGPVEFSHYSHIDILGKNCPTCHNDIFNIVTKKNPVFTMSDMENGKSCGACHNGDKAFGVKDDCSTCHPTRDIAIKVEATGETLFSHDVHTGMYGCSECHPGLFVPQQGKNSATMKQMENGESCGACHDGDTAFGVKGDCSTCHPTKEIVFEVEATGKTLFSHDVHTGMYGCSECHPGLFVPGPENKRITMAQMEDGESCGACHDGDTAFGVKNDCSSCHPTKDITFKVPDAGNATFSHDIHTGMYGCSDCHPGLFTPAQGKNRATMAQMEDGESCGACHEGDTAFSVAESCDACHQM